MSKLLHKTRGFGFLENSSHSLRNWSVCLPAAILVLVLSAHSLTAAEVYRRGEESPVTGEVTEVGKTEVTVKPRIGSAQTIPANEIVRMKWDGEPAGLNLARSAEESGQLNRALENYEGFLEELGSDKKNLKADVQFLAARVTAKMALTDPSKIDAAIEKLEAFRTTHVTHFRYFPAVDYLGRVYLAKEDFEKARTIFNLLSEAPWDDYKLAAQTAKAQLLLHQDDLAGAISAFDSVIQTSADGPGEALRRYEAMLGKAECFLRQSKLAEASQLLKRVTKEAPAENSQLQAEAYLRLGNALQTQGKTKEALLAYLHIDVLFSKERLLHAEALYHLTQLWAATGHPERAAEARAKLESDYPNSEWMKKLTTAQAG